MTQVLLADDDPLFRGRIRRMLGSWWPEAQLLEVSSLPSAMAKADDAKKLSLMLLDLHLPGTRDLSGVIELRRRHQDVPLAVLSAGPKDTNCVRKALTLGANGFIVKSCGLETLRKRLIALRTGVTMSPPTVGELPAIPHMPAKLASLTRAQLRILCGLERGRLNKQIAYEMGVTEATVKAHLTAIFRKLGVSNRDQAQAAALWLRVDPPAA